MALPRSFKIDDALLDALRQVESGRRGDAVSPAGAVGEYQFLPETAEELGIDPLDPKQAREGARRLLQSHLDRFGDPELALMAYHAGAGNVDRYARGEKSRVGPLTKAYPKKVFAAMGNRATDALPEVPGPRYSSDDDESSLGGATDLDFDLGDLDLDARKRAARLRAEAVAAGQKIPPGSIGYEGASAEDRDPEADLDAARGVRDLFVPQSTTDLGLMAAMGPGRVPVKAGLGALGMAVDAWDAEAAMGPNFAKRFFSPLVELVRNLDVKKPLTERAWRELLEPNPKSGKTARFRDRRTGLDHPVTPDEWEFARGDAILKDLGDPKRFKSGETPAFTKDELADLLDAEYPGLETRELGNLPGDMTEAEFTRYRAFDNRVAAIQRGENAWPLSEIERAEYDRLGNLYPNNRPALHPPQYSEYTLKGPRTEGSYQESLTKFERHGDRDIEAEVTAAEAKTQAALDELNASPPTPGAREAYHRAQSELTALRALRDSDSYSDFDQSFIPRAAHFQSEPNLMAHSRADRRTTVDGLKARHVDELQSDWHQQARDEGGYRDRTPLTEDERAELGALQKRDHDFDGNAGEYMRWRESAEGQRYRDLLARAEGVVAENRPPPAPLRKNWHEVELKKQLAQAIEDGDEVLTWTTGDQQIERYKSALRQQVDKIDWVRHPDGKYDITPVKGGRPVNTSSARSKLEGLTDRELEDTIGTEMARKIREQPGIAVGKPLTGAEFGELNDLRVKRNIAARPEDFTDAERVRLEELRARHKANHADFYPDGTKLGTLQGDDLTVGGAGMRSFYDREVVETAKKLAKKYGGEYVKTELPGTVNPAANKRVAPRDQSLVDSLSDAHRDTLWKNAIRGTRGAHRDISAIQPLIDAAKRARLSPLEIERLSQGVLEHSRSKFDNAYAALKFLLQKTKHPSHSVHAIKITPQMREMLAKTGGKFSLYADGGEVWPKWLDEEPAVGMAGGGSIMRALLKRLGLASETPEMGRMSSEELIRPFAREASSERQVVDELENPARRELLFGRAKPELPPVEMVDEAASTRNLPALRDEALPLAELEGESFQGLSPLEQAARHAQRYEPNRRVFLQGAASMASVPKRLELLSDVAPKLVEATKPKVIMPRTTLIDRVAELVSKANMHNKRVEWEDVQPRFDLQSVHEPDDIDDFVSKRLKVPKEHLAAEFPGDEGLYGLSRVLSVNLDDTYLYEMARDMARGIGPDGVKTIDDMIKREAEMAGVSPKDLRRAYLKAREHEADVNESWVRDSPDTLDDAWREHARQAGWEPPDLHAGERHEAALKHKEEISKLKPLTTEEQKEYRKFLNMKWDSPDFDSARFVKLQKRAVFASKDVKKADDADYRNGGSIPATEAPWPKWLDERTVA